MKRYIGIGITICFVALLAPVARNQWNSFLAGQRQQAIQEGVSQLLTMQGGTQCFKDGTAMFTVVAGPEEEKKDPQLKDWQAKLGEQQVQQKKLTFKLSDEASGAFKDDIFKGTTVMLNLPTMVCVASEYAARGGR